MSRATASAIAVPGGDLTVGTWGPVVGNGFAEPVVVAVHGITATHRSWPFLAAALPDRTLVAPDLRGRGGSRGLPGPFGLAAHADDVATVVRAVSPGRPVDLVGHSMGAFVAVVLADRHPDLVHRLVLVDGGLPFAPAEQGTTEAALAAIRARLEARFESAEAYVDLFRTHPAFAADWTPEAEAYALYDAVEREPGTFGSSASVEAVLADQADITDGSSLGAALAELPRATFLHARRGFVDDPPGLYAADTVEELATRFPQVTTRLVDGVNHYTVVLSERGAAAIADAVRSGPLAP